MAAVFLYMANNGADANATTIAYMKQVEGKDQGQWNSPLLKNMQSLYFRRHGVNPPWQMRSVALCWGLRRPTLPTAVARGNIQHCGGPAYYSKEPSRMGFCMYFCRVKCRLRYECLVYFYHIKYRYVR